MKIANGLIALKSIIVIHINKAGIRILYSIYFVFVCMFPSGAQKG